MTRTFYRMTLATIEKVVYKTCDKVITKRFYEWHKRKNEWRLIEIGSNIPIDVLKTTTFDAFLSVVVNSRKPNNATAFFSKEEWLKHKGKEPKVGSLDDILYNKIFKEE